MRQGGWVTTSLDCGSGFAVRENLFCNERNFYEKPVFVLFTNSKISAVGSFVRSFRGMAAAVFLQLLFLTSPVAA